jgi:hypothetical protein
MGALLAEKSAQANTKLTVELFESAGIPVTKSRSSVTNPGTFGANIRTKDFFEATIAGAWQKTVQGIFDTGKWLLAAKEELDPEVFKVLRLPFGPRTKQRLMAIAGNAVLATHASLCPPHWVTLYALSRIDDKKLLAKFRNNTISPSLERHEVRTKILGLPAKTKTKIAAPAVAPAGTAKVEPEPITAATDAATATMAAVEAKDVDWLLRVMPKTMRAKLHERVVTQYRRQNGSAHGEVDLRASEILRNVLSRVKIATAPGISPAAAAAHQHEIIAALSRLNVTLAEFDIDEITIIRRHAKEARRAKSRRRAL